MCKALKERKGFISLGNGEDMAGDKYREVG